MTITVSSAADTPDVLPGDGICADAQGRCTLRAAITEADRIKGDDVHPLRPSRSGPGDHPAQLPAPYITSRAGTMTIDGYSQPGARVNSSTVGSDAVPGSRSGATATAPGRSAPTSPAWATPSGLLIDTIYRGILLDGADAHDNRVVGDGLVHQDRGSPSTRASTPSFLNTGASGDVVGSPDLADRNVVGNFDKAVDLYGPGTDGNIIQNNVFCIRPGGIGAAPCAKPSTTTSGPATG